MALSPTIHARFMEHALNLAVRASRKTLPNPCVGALVVRDGQIIGQGYHQAYGAPHAEPNAIHSVADPVALADSTLYVTLEPCAHFGKTPPCAELIIASKIPRVVVGCRDPFPEVAGRGIEKLRAAGVQVTEDILHDQCVLANKRFILAHRLHRPYIILKWAQTLDGFIAPKNPIRTQISSPESVGLTHYWRGQEMAILIGANTARVDNPLLTVRHTERYQPHELPVSHPHRIVIGGATPLPSDLLVWNNDAPTLLLTTTRSSHATIPSHIEQYALDGDIPIPAQICAILYKRALLSVLIEGGSKTLQMFLKAGLWDEIRVFTAPSRFGRGVPAPQLAFPPERVVDSGLDTLSCYYHPELHARLGLKPSTPLP